VTVPANLTAGLLAASAGHVSLSIVTPLGGSNIPSTTLAELITGVASSPAGNITTIQYQIDGGVWNNFVFTPGPSVSYSGGNAGQLSAGQHVITVKATDAANNTTTVSSTYTITAAAPSTSYSWGPPNVYLGQNTYLTITASTPNATVGYTQTEYDAHGNVIAVNPMATLGTTNGAGNFSFTGAAGWVPGGWTDRVQLYVGGVEVATFGFANVGSNPQYTYGPSVAPNGTVSTLNISNSWASSTVTAVTTFMPSGTVTPVATLGTTNSNGSFSISTTAGWGSDTSCEVQISLNGVPVETFGFTP
jgi:hypothetical protein